MTSSPAHPLDVGLATEHHGLEQRGPGCSVPKSTPTASTHFERLAGQGAPWPVSAVVRREREAVRKRPRINSADLEDFHFQSLCLHGFGGFSETQQFVGIARLLETAQRKRV
jgi:hypothetical protein